MFLYHRSLPMLYDEDDCSSSDESEDSQSVASRQDVRDAEVVAREDVFDKTIRTSIIPVRIKQASFKGQRRDMIHMTQSPRCGISPHGYTMKTWVHNIKRAVAAENTGHVMDCLTTYFIWFQTAELIGDKGVIRLVPIRNQTLYTKFLEHMCAGGVFNNRWSAFLHQNLFLTIFDVFFECIGVCGPLLVSHIQGLWRQYELSLFCIPQRSLSKLLTIGNVMVSAQKNGAVFYANYVFSDTAQMKRKREQMVENADVIRSVLRSDLAETVLTDLDQFEAVHFRQRHRKNLYKECYVGQQDDEFLDLGNVVHLIQALPVSDKKAGKIINRQRDVALRSTSMSSVMRNRYLRSLEDITTMYSLIVRQPNSFACRKLGRQVLSYALVYTHLLSKLASLGEDVWSSCYIPTDEVNHGFCEQYWMSSQQNTIVMSYGVTMEKNVLKSHNLKLTKGPRIKKRKVSVNEQEEIKANGGPSVVAISHENAYPASKCHDGYFHLADFVSHCNYTLEIFPQLEAMYFTGVNLSHLLRQHRRPPSSRGTVPVTDSVFLDTSLLKNYDSMTHVGFCQKFVTKPLECKTETFGAVWSGDADVGAILFDHLCGIQDNDTCSQQHRPMMWVCGPFGVESQDIEQDFEQYRDLRRALGFNVGESSFRQLVVQNLPIPPDNMNIYVGRAYLFYIEELPAALKIKMENDGVKYAAMTRPILEFVEILRKTGMWQGKIKDLVQDRITQLALLFEYFGSTRDWDFTRVTLECKMDTSGTIYFGNVSIVPPPLGWKRVPNSTRNPQVYAEALKIFDQPQDYQRLHGLGCKRLVSSITNVCPRYLDDVKVFFSKDIEVEIEFQ